MTLAEITAHCKAYGKQHKQSLQERASLLYTHIQLIYSVLGRALTGKGQVPTIYDAFPGFFEEKAAGEQLDADVMKARVEAFAVAKRNRNGGVSDGDDTG
jgi:hypothetical protein